MELKDGAIFSESMFSSPWCKGFMLKKNQLGVIVFITEHEEC